MNAEIKARWLDALKSGKYKRGTGFLSYDGRHCCLGVLCELAVEDGIITKTGLRGPTFDYGIGKDVSQFGLPAKVQAWSGIDNPLGRFKSGLRGNLSSLNDSKESLADASYDVVIPTIEAYF